MVNRYLRLMSAIVVLGSALTAQAQEATEMYIPLGQSPGVSGKTSLLGTLESVDAAKRTVTVAGPSGARTVGLTDRTSIWLDRSLQKQPNRSGTMADLQRGHRVEIKLRKGEPTPVAEWIKVQVAEGRP
ncbi:MAG TPA: hypothetical protein VH881_10315 [Burkholderiales bacterium]|jgi:hypothetical protein